jgi:hypothetical protein
MIVILNKIMCQIGEIMISSILPIVQANKDSIKNKLPF